MKLSSGVRQRSFDPDGPSLEVDVLPSEAEHHLSPEREPEREVRRGVPGVGPPGCGEDPLPFLRRDDREVAQLPDGTIDHRGIRPVLTNDPLAHRTSERLRGEPEDVGDRLGRETTAEKLVAEAFDVARSEVRHPDSADDAVDQRRVASALRIRCWYKGPAAPRHAPNGWQVLAADEPAERLPARRCERSSVSPAKELPLLSLSRL